MTMPPGSADGGERATHSESVDDYLKAILDLTGDGEDAQTSALARRLDVTPASVTGMLRRLASADPPLVVYRKHRGASLTEAGRLRALEVLRHHRLIERFLHDTLGYSWDEVHAEAEKLEHAISETLEDRIAEALGDPEVDPHGHPIPRKDGSVPELDHVCLLDVEPEASVAVARVADDRPEMLRYLTELGLTLGTLVTVVSRAPFEGPLMVRVAGSSEAVALAPEIAGGVFVAAPG